MDAAQSKVDFTSLTEKQTNEKGEYFFTVLAHTKTGRRLYKRLDEKVAAKVIHSTLGIESKVTVNDNGDGTYTVVFEKVADGPYFVVVGILHENGRIIEHMLRGSPFNVYVGIEPKPESIIVDPSRTVLTGFGARSAFVKKKSSFHLRLKDASGVDIPTGGHKIEVKAKTPPGSKLSSLPSATSDYKDGSYVVTYSPNAVGPHTFDVLVEGQLILGCPFVVEAVEISSELEFSPVDSELDLKSVSSNEEGVITFVVVSKNFAKSECQITPSFKFKATSADGQNGGSINQFDNGDGTFSIKYRPNGPGAHEVQVMAVVNGADCHVNGSPLNFNVKIYESVDDDETTFKLSVRRFAEVEKFVKSAPQDIQAALDAAKSETKTTAPPSAEPASIAKPAPAVAKEYKAYTPSVKTDKKPEGSPTTERPAVKISVASPPAKRPATHIPPKGTGAKFVPPKAT